MNFSLFRSTCQTYSKIEFWFPITATSTLKLLNDCANSVYSFAICGSSFPTFFNNRLTLSFMWFKFSFTFFGFCNICFFCFSSSICYVIGDEVAETTLPKDNVLARELTRRTDSFDVDFSCVEESNKDCRSTGENNAGSGGGTVRGTDRGVSNTFMLFVIWLSGMSCVLLSTFTVFVKSASYSAGQGL